MPPDPHIGDDWNGAPPTNPAAEIVALRRDVRRLEARIEALEQDRDRREEYEREQNERGSE